MAKYKEIWTSVFVILAIVIFILGKNYLTDGIFPFNKDNKFYVNYNNVTGLTKSKPVYLNGFKVGYISDLALRPKGDVLVELRIDKKFEMPAKSIARLVSIDILGNKTVIIIPSEEDELALNGDTLNSEVERGLAEKFEPIQKNAQTVLVNLDNFLLSANKLFNEDFINDFHGTVENVHNISARLLTTTTLLNENIGVTLKNLNATTRYIKEFSKDINEHSEHLTYSLKQLNSITRKIDEANVDSLIISMNGLVYNLKEITESLHSSKGSMGKFINDTTLYNSLNKTIVSLDTLLSDLSNNPKRYVHFSLFGKKDKKR